MNGYPAQTSAISPSIPLSGEVAETAAVECNGVEPQDTQAAEPGPDTAEPEDDEAQVRKARVSPQLPSASELCAHKLSHIPYRAWCDECVECFGREWGHPGDGQLASRSVPVISMDYLFVSPNGIFGRGEIPEEEAATSLKVLVVYDSATKCVFAQAVARKGAEPYTVQCVVDDIVWLGHCKVIVRSDNEPAMIALALEALRGLRVEGLASAAAEGSVPYDPQTNGAAQVAVQLSKKQMRAVLLTLQKQVHAEIPPSHPVMTWLVAHAANLRNICKVGSDGQTPHARARGAANRSELYGFGEYCKYKCRSHEGSATGTTAGAHLPGRTDRWGLGVWLGFEKRTGQYVIFDSETKKIAHARTLMHVPDEDKWKRAEIDGIAVVPWDLHVRSEPETRFQDSDIAPQVVP